MKSMENVFQEESEECNDDAEEDNNNHIRKSYNEVAHVDDSEYSVFLLLEC
jgi:hypothetical protein